MTVVEVLKTARAKVAKGWCKGTLAKGARGGDVAPESPTAAKWCARGAILAASVNVGHDIDWLATDYLRAAAGNVLLLSCWNDDPGTKKRDVLAAFDGAILLADAKAGTP